MRRHLDFIHKHGHFVKKTGHGLIPTQHHYKLHKHLSNLHIGRGAVAHKHEEIMGGTILHHNKHTTHQTHKKRNIEKIKFNF